MAKFRFIKPDTTRLQLSEGDWIEVKKILTYGEQQRLSGAALTTIKSDPSKPNAGNEFGLDWEHYNLRRLEIWIVDWSFRDENDKQVKVTRDAIGNLDPETVAEIDEALTKHIEAVEEAKKVPSGKRT